MPPLRATLRTGSRAAATREPCQVRKEAALSEPRRVPRNGLVRAARRGGRGSVPVDGGCTASRSHAARASTRSLVTTTGDRTTSPHQALYRRWRAQTFAEIVGQDGRRRDAPQRRPIRPRRARDPLRRPARHGQDVARPDPRQGAQLHEPPGRRSVRRLRRLRRDPRGPGPRPRRDRRRVEPRHRRRSATSASGSTTRPTDLRRKVYILDEAHQITKDAWNALLKSLEEPPDFVTFMFASTHPQDFPPAILSRLQRFDVRRLTVPEIEGKLERILAAEAVEAEPDAIHLVARLAAGGMRDAESMLDQLLAVGRRTGSTRPASATCWASPTPRRSTPRDGARRRRRRRRDRDPRRARGARPRPRRRPRPGRRARPDATSRPRSTARPTPARPPR